MSSILKESVPKFSCFAVFAHFAQISLAHPLEKTFKVFMNSLINEHYRDEKYKIN